jgi:wyosine [tRNA(Phe)-imidazoG37] synthetase (radical SAM superfamily)
MSYRYVFGPVRSSRLGVSLGLDLLGRAVCSMDCLYCEVGPTRELTRTRAPYVPAAELLAELARWKDEHAGAHLDYVTLGGMGEPCLNTGLAEVIAGAKRLFPDTPVAVLTNATLLADAAVRAELAQADAVLPSLDSLVPEEFARINRPAPGLTPVAVAEGILAFARTYPGRIFLEVLLLSGVNDSEENLARLTAFVARLRPARVDVTTMTRPGAYPAAKAAGPATLARFREALGASLASRAVREPAPEATATPGAATAPLTPEEIREIVLNSIARRPQTAADLRAALARPPEEVAKALAELEADGRIVAVDGFYRPLRRARND